jgi:hypothetical protein
MTRRYVHPTTEIVESAFLGMEDLAITLEDDAAPKSGDGVAPRMQKGVAKVVASRTK